MIDKRKKKKNAYLYFDWEKIGSYSINQMKYIFNIHSDIWFKPLSPQPTHIYHVILNRLFEKEPLLIWFQDL